MANEAKHQVFYMGDVLTSQRLPSSIIFSTSSSDQPFKMETRPSLLRVWNSASIDERRVLLGSSECPA
jgi:hypothetical protein